LKTFFLFLGLPKILTMKNLLFLVFCIVFTSCFVNKPRYFITGTHENIPTLNTSSDKWVVTLQNFSSGAEYEVIAEIKKDFELYFPGNYEFKSRFLNIDPFQPITAKLTKEELDEVKIETNGKYLAVFKAHMKYELPKKIIEIKYESDQKFRTMFVFLDVYNLETNELIYTKYAASQLDLKATGNHKAQTGVKKQAVKTYEKLKKDFENTFLIIP
jgi:hypothetical protein